MALGNFWRGILGTFNNAGEGQKPSQPESLQNIQPEGISSTQEEDPPIQGMSTEEMIVKGFKPRPITMRYPENPIEGSGQEKKV